MANIESVVGLRISTTILLNTDHCGLWLLNEPVNSPICFHHVNEGECLLSIDGEEAVRLKSGDFVVFTRFTKHLLTPLCQNKGSDAGLLSLNDKVVSIICGIASPQNNVSNSIIRRLPSYFIINADNKYDGYDFLNESLKLENKIHGKKIFHELNRILELIFAMSVRYMLENDTDNMGINLLEFNPKLQPAIEAMQRNPEKLWTLFQLARLCNMSRTVFSNAFRQTMGITAMEFLLDWRMNIAWELLLRSNEIFDTACHVGYQSESAFSNAFHRYHGVRPGKVRLLHQEAL